MHLTSTNQTGKYIFLESNKMFLDRLSIYFKNHLLILQYFIYILPTIIQQISTKIQLQIHKRHTFTKISLVLSALKLKITSIKHMPPINVRWIVWQVQVCGYRNFLYCALPRRVVTTRRLFCNISCEKHWQGMRRAVAIVSKVFKIFIIKVYTGQCHILEGLPTYFLSISQ